MEIENTYFSWCNMVFQMKVKKCSGFLNSVHTPFGSQMDNNWILKRFKQLHRILTYHNNLERDSCWRWGRDSLVKDTSIIFSYQLHTYIPATKEKFFLTVFGNYHTSTSGFLITFLGTVVQRWSCSPLCFWTIVLARDFVPRNITVNSTCHMNQTIFLCKNAI